MFEFLEDENSRSLSQDRAIPLGIEWPWSSCRYIIEGR
jgi:hypothetical protein